MPLQIHAHSLYGPAGTCAPVASASPIHVPQMPRILKHCDAHIYIIHILIYIYIYIYTHVCNPKQSYDTPAGGFHPPAGV